MSEKQNTEQSREAQAAGSELKATVRPETGGVVVRTELGYFTDHPNKDIYPVPVRLHDSWISASRYKSPEDATNALRMAGLGHLAHVFESA